jgi:hypothetical protein
MKEVTQKSGGYSSNLQPNLLLLFQATRHFSLILYWEPTLRSVVFNEETLCGCLQHPAEEHNDLKASAKDFTLTAHRIKG